MTKHLSDDRRRGAWAGCRLGVSYPRITRYGIQAMVAAFVAAVLLGSGNSTWATEGEPDGSAQAAAAQATTAAQPEAEKESRAPAYTVEMTAEHTAQVSRSPYVAPTPSANEHFVIGQTKGWPENPDFADSPYSQAITARDSTIKPHVLVGHPGQVRRWGASEDGLQAGFSTSTEQSHAISVERCLEIGRTYGLALYDVVVP